jgi:hypothetical protein
VQERENAVDNKEPSPKTRRLLRGALDKIFLQPSKRTAWYTFSGEDE